MISSKKNIKVDSINSDNSVYKNMLKQYDEHERGNGSKYDEIEQKAIMMISCIENHSFNQGRLLHNRSASVRSTLFASRS